MGGAGLLAVEHASEWHQSFLGSLPQIGAPIGLLLSTSSRWKPRAAFRHSECLCPDKEQVLYA
jgi:hypothetical protein